MLLRRSDGAATVETRRRHYAFKVLLLSSVIHHQATGRAVSCMVLGALVGFLGFLLVRQSTMETELELPVMKLIDIKQQMLKRRGDVCGDVL